ncbi:hypothetical protein [Streptomyces sp. NBC_01314]|uniref:hypothetical protein n=1 Tax=Streptomyces sp. NBC_01314 TaxID=2903821 RepID=UPI00308B858A|nr:hypothetical protein OG622_43510 [Streptomyces sp. NBC_01314]
MAVGWTLALFAATSALLAFAALYRTAPRGAAETRPGPPDRNTPDRSGSGPCRTGACSPHLRRRIHEDPSPRPPRQTGPVGSG